MMIEDEALRSQYKTTSEERLQKIEAGLLHLEQQADDEAVLETLRQEVYRLKCDSRRASLESVMILTQQVEDLLESLQHQEIFLTLEVSDRIHFGINTISQLVYEAVTGEPAAVDMDEVVKYLLEPALLASESAPEIAPAMDFPKNNETPLISSQGNPVQEISSQENPVQEISSQENPAPEISSQENPALEIPALEIPAPEIPALEILAPELPAQENSVQEISSQENLAPEIPPQEIPAQETPALESPAQEISGAALRKIYKAFNQRRLQKLESGLLHLATAVDDNTLLRELLQEIRGLKNDSKQIESEMMVTLAQQFETVLTEVQRQGLVLSIELCVHLYESLKAMEQGVNAVAPDESDEPTPLASPKSSITAAEEPSEQSIVAKIDALLQSIPDISEDEELRQIYKNISKGRLQKLEANLAQLEKHPDDTAILAEILREAHSLKGDSRSVGINAVEIFTHTFEDIIVGIQDQQIAFTPALSNSLALGLTAIAQLVSEASILNPKREIVSSKSNSLKTAISGSTAGKDQVTVPFRSPEAISQSSSLALELDIPRHSDTIYIQAGDLDALMLPVEDLVTARIEIAQATAQLEQIAVLLEKGRTDKSQTKFSTTLRFNPHEEQLENLIATFRIAAQANSAKLGLIAEDLREQIGALRLHPLNNIFQLFPRLVQDLAKQQSKQVEVKIEGGETTVDKCILAEIKDSLLHLVCNAIDHGVETPTERKSRNKPPTATIWLRGYQTDTGAVIEVTDDGRGLDIEQIKQTAIRRQLYRPEELAVMTTDQIQSLILAPGFSTRTVITEVSGRGVGLDVVHTHIERLQGNVQINSTPGQGCTFRLQLSPNYSADEVSSGLVNDPCFVY